MYYGDDLSKIVYHNNYNDGCFPHVAIHCEYLSFFRYDVGFVDVVNIDTVNFQCITRLYFFSVLHNY